MIGLGRGYGHKQVAARCLTILKIIDALSKTSYTYTQLHIETKIQRNILRKLLDLLASKEMITQNNYSIRREGNRQKRRKYYTLNRSNPRVAAVINKKESKATTIEILEQLSILILKNGKFTNRFDGSSAFPTDNKQESITKLSLAEQPKDESPNVISKQFEYLIEDMKYYNDNFLKHYYPPKRHQVYYARAIWLQRQLLRQYSDNRYHRDPFDWSEIYLAHRGLHPSGKSAKELSSRYGEKIRRYDKQTREPIFGRKGISKRHIQRKSKDIVKYFQEFYKLMPLFFFMHTLFKNKKEKLIVDNVIDRKQFRI